MGSGRGLRPVGRLRPTGWAHSAVFSWAFLHSSGVSITKPLALQELWPEQSLVAVLQADWPLQLLAPSHLIFASSALAVVAPPAMKIAAAADASRIDLDFMEVNLRDSRCAVGQPARLRFGV